MEDQKLYVAFFKFNGDGDYSFADWENLNYKYKLFYSKDAAKRAILKHIKTVAETITTSKDRRDLKEELEGLYDVYSDPEFFDHWTEIYADMGNPGLEYFVEEVDFFDTSKLEDEI